MAPRTWLTTPPGQEPETIGARTRDAEEVYSRGFAMPTEPGLPRRWPWVAAAMGAFVLLVELVYLLLPMTGVEEQDPSLSDTPGEVASVSLAVAPTTRPAAAVRTRSTASATATGVSHGT